MFWHSLQNTERINKKDMSPMMCAPIGSFILISYDMNLFRVPTASMALVYKKNAWFERSQHNKIAWVGSKVLIVSLLLGFNQLLIEFSNQFQQPPTYLFLLFLYQRIKKTRYILCKLNFHPWIWGLLYSIIK